MSLNHVMITIFFGIIAINVVALTMLWIIAIYNQYILPFIT